MASTPIGRARLAIPGWPGAGDIRTTADEAMTKLYEEHARPLLGIAALLTWLAIRPRLPLLTGVTVTAGSLLNSAPDSIPAGGPGAGEHPTLGAFRGLETVSGIAEEIVHDSFAGVHREWRRLRDIDRAVTYLRRSTVQGTRVLRDGERAPSLDQPQTVDRPQAENRPSTGDQSPPASPGSGVSLLSTRVLSALRGLPGRQREALVLRYYADLPEAQAAAAMGVSRAAFCGHAARGMTALRRLVDQLSTA